MSLVTRASTQGMDAASAMYAPQLSGLTAGEALDAISPCYIKESDGFVYMCNATAADEAAELDGWTATAYPSGATSVTLFGTGTKFRYATGMTPGAILYMGATAGRLDTAATTGDGYGLARVISSTVIRVLRDSPVGGVTDLSVGTADIAAGAVTFAKAKVFISAETTATGSAQNVAHGLGTAPTGVLVVPTEHPGTPDTGAFDIAEGSHTSTNVVVTVTVNVKFKVFAWA